MKGIGERFKTEVENVGVDHEMRDSCSSSRLDPPSSRQQSDETRLGELGGRGKRASGTEPLPDRWRLFISPTGKRGVVGAKRAPKAHAML